MRKMKPMGVIELNETQIKELKWKPKRDLKINERIFLLELQIKNLQKKTDEGRLVNKGFQEWLKQFPDESKIILKDSKLVLVTPDEEEWECTNYIMQ